MISETEQKRQWIDLEFLQTTINNAGIKTQLIPASEEFPQPVLIGSMPDSYQGPEAEFQLTYLAIEGMLSEVTLLQIHLYLAKELKEEEINHKDLFYAMNTRSLLGYFGMEEGQLFFRYVFTNPRYNPPNEEVFMEALGLCFGNFGNFANLIAQLDQGEKSRAELIHSLEQE